MGKCFLHGNGGKMVKRASGTFTTDADGSATVNCGFQPDLVVIDSPFTAEYKLVAPFEVINSGSDQVKIEATHDEGIIYAGLIQTGNGFTVSFMNNYDWDWNYVAVASTNCTYTAIKYT